MHKFRSQSRGEAKRTNFRSINHWKTALSVPEMKSDASSTSGWSPHSWVGKKLRVRTHWTPERSGTKADRWRNVYKYRTISEFKRPLGCGSRNGWSSFKKAHQVAVKMKSIYLSLVLLMAATPSKKETPTKKSERRKRVTRSKMIHDSMVWVFSSLGSLKNHFCRWKFTLSLAFNHNKKLPSTLSRDFDPTTLTPRLSGPCSLSLWL